jgi:hypothetical protein
MADMLLKILKWRLKSNNIDRFLSIQLDFKQKNFIIKIRERRK